MRVAAEAGAQVVLLPEMWPTSFVPDADDACLAASAAAVDALARVADERGVTVVGSAYGPRAPLPTNRAHVLSGGETLAHYDKVHLFSPTAETVAFSAGAHPPPVVVVSGTDVRLAPIVCYDLRFPEVARAAFRAGAEILAVVAQWPVQRAPHLGALVRGRAAELEGFVVAANRGGADLVGRRRMRLAFDGAGVGAAGPSGAELAPVHEERIEAGDRAPSLVRVFDLDLAEARALRRAVPVARDDRPDVYPRWR